MTIAALLEELSWWGTDGPGPRTIVFEHRARPTVLTRVTLVDGETRHAFEANSPKHALVQALAWAYAQSAEHAER